MTFHKVIYGIFIKHYCGEKSYYGFTGLYAFAGKSNAYFDKKSYIVIALAPVIIFGLLFLMLNILLSKDLFWIIYIIQIVNLSE